MKKKYKEELGDSMNYQTQVEILQDLNTEQQKAIVKLNARVNVYENDLRGQNANIQLISADLKVCIDCIKKLKKEIDVLKSHKKTKNNV